MKFGMNLLLWGGEINETHYPLFEELKKMGFDGLEIPIFNPGLDYGAIATELENQGLERTAVTVRTEEDNPISPESPVRSKGVAATKQVLDVCHTLGATHLVGPYHSALGLFSGAPPSDDEWQWGVESMQQVAEHAGGANVMLGVECLNRFETYFLTCHSDAAKFVKAVDHPNCRMMYDTFHANIEEKNVTQAVKGCADVMCHVHISENDRSTPGAGDVKWDETFDVLKEVGYDGWLTIEAFGNALPELAAATCIWRKMFESEEQLARDGLAFMKQQHARCWG